MSHPVSWQQVTLIEACELYQPQTISKAEMESSGPFPVYGANGIIGRHSDFNHPNSEVLLACRGNVGTVNVSEPKAWINGNAMVCRPRDEKRLRKDFLAFALQAMDLRSAITGTAQLQITRSSLGPLPLSIPPVDEQVQIVRIIEEQFSRLDAATSSLAKIGELHRALVASIAYNAVSTRLDDSPVVNLSDVLELHRGYDLPVQSRECGDVPVVASNGIVGRHNVAKVSGPGVVTGRSGTIGRVQLIQEDFWPLNTTLYVSDFRENHPAYIALLLETLNLSQFAGGSTVPSLDRNVLKNLSVSVPEFSMQVELADRAQHQRKLVEPLGALSQALLRRFTVLRRALLHSAFTGELTKKWREKNNG